MESDRKESDRARRTPDSGPVLHATRRGALVLQTEKARQMMSRFKKLQPSTSGEPSEDVGTAPAGS